jgi:hypothetical protein
MRFRIRRLARPFTPPPSRDKSRNDRSFDEFDMLSFGQFYSSGKC